MAEGTIESGFWWNPATGKWEYSFRPPPALAVGEDLLRSKFTDAMQKVNSSYYEAQTQMGMLHEYLMNLTPFEIFPMFDSPEFERFVLSKSDKPEAPIVSFPEFAMPDLDTPTPGFNYYEKPYDSYLRDALKLKLATGVTNGGTGLGASVEDAIFERDRLRREQALRDAKDRVQAEWSENGAGDLGLPDGLLSAQYAALETEHLQKEQSVSFDTAIKMAELGRQQEEVYLTQGNAIENIMQNKHTADETRALEAAKVEPEIVLRTFEAQLAKVKAMGEYYNAIAVKANAQAQIFKAQMDGWATEIDGGAKELLASTQKYDSDTKLAAAESEAHYRADTNKIEQLKSFFNLRAEGLKALAQLSANMTAALATSVSASVSSGIQQSTSDQTSKSDSTNRQFYWDMTGD